MYEAKVQWETGFISQVMRLSSESQLYKIELYDLYVLYTCNIVLYYARNKRLN